MPLSNTQMRDVQSILHPYTNLVKHRETGPVIFERGKGVFVYDDHGKDYIEGMSGLWCTALGWGDAALADVAAEAGVRGFRVAPDTDVDAVRRRQVDAMADLVTEHLDLDAIMRLIRQGPPRHPKVIRHHLEDL